MIGFETRVSGWSKNRSPRATINRRAVRTLRGKLPLGVAEALAGAIRQRVFTEGKPARTPVNPYSQQGRVAVNPHYELTANLPQPLFRTNADGIPVFASAEHMHSRMKRWTYVISGGMRDGLKAHRRKGGGAIVQFRGKSVGRELVRRRKTVPGTQYKARIGPPLKNWIDNHLKAWTVLDKHRVHLLEPTADEYASIGEAVAYVAADIVHLILDMPTRRVSGGRPRSAIGKAVAQNVRIGGAL